MLTYSKIIYIFVYVKDLAASRKFYEETLGFAVLEEDPDAVKYDVGELILALNRASDYNLHLKDTLDDTSLLVFHVDDHDTLRRTLEARGIVFPGPPLEYEIGVTSTFYDPDGHCFTLYQPSDESMTWPSATKYRAILASSSDTGQVNSRNEASTGLSLGAHKMVYLFLFVSELNEAYEFYAKKLQLAVIEEDAGSGVVKYDGGGVLLTTHLVGGDVHAKTDVEMTHERSIAPVFYVPDIQQIYDQLSDQKIKFDYPVRWLPIGGIARFTDPFGNPFYLYQPSVPALTSPSGHKLQSIIAKKM